MVRKVKNVAFFLKFFYGFVLGTAAMLLVLQLSKTVRVLPCSEDSLAEAIVINRIPFNKNVNQKSSKKLVFVGVMTAKKYLGTRAEAIYKTWGKEVPGKIMFFAGELANQTNTNLPLVTLPNVEDTYYPPQKKSFMMLKYIYEHYGNNFEWFIRADDDVYIKTKALETFLRSINSSKLYFIGQAGKGNQEELGTLSLKFNENFCMGGPGIIFSRGVLMKIIPHIKECLKNLYSYHEDVELGRCVQRFAKVSCTWSYEMQSLFYHNYSGEFSVIDSLRSSEVYKAMTFHPIKSPVHMYRFHNHMKSLELKELYTENIKKHRELYRMNEDLKFLNFSLNLFSLDEVNALGNFSNLGLPISLNKFLPENTSEILSWDFFHKSYYAYNDFNPKRKIDNNSNDGITDAIRDVLDSINQYSKERGRIIEFTDVYYGYRRINPLYGVDYVLDLLLLYKKYRGRKMTVKVRRHVYLQQSFGNVKMRELFPDNEDNVETENVQELPILTDDLDEQKLSDASNTNQVIMKKNLKSIKSRKIVFILPLFGRHVTFDRFLKNYEEICLKNLENVKLIIVFFSLDAKDSQLILQYIKGLEDTYPGSQFTIVSIRKEFSRAFALHLGATKARKHDLLFFIDVDIVFTLESLYRIRLNTIKGSQVYFPIVFSEYSGEERRDHFVIDELGFWRNFGYGIVSIYKQDLELVGGLDTSIKGWGREDVNLYDKVLASKLDAFRSPDPGIIHVYHPVICQKDNTPEQYEMCLGSRINTYASLFYYAQSIFNNTEILSL